jgi:Farnesoic acid 0-methyl transferase
VTGPLLCALCVQADAVPGAKLSSAAFTRFWIDFNAGSFSVGVGPPGSGRSYRWTDPDPILGIEYVGLSTWDKHVGYRNIQLLPSSGGAASGGAGPDPMQVYTSPMAGAGLEWVESRCRGWSGELLIGGGQTPAVGGDGPLCAFPPLPAPSASILRRQPPPSSTATAAQLSPSKLPPRPKVSGFQLALSQSSAGRPQNDAASGPLALLILNDGRTMAERCGLQPSGPAHPERWQNDGRTMRPPALWPCSS